MTRFGHHLEAQIGAGIDPALQKKWDEKLTPVPSNPFPLAPRDLVRLGLVTLASYREQNAVWRRSVCRIIRREARSVRTQALRPSDIIGQNWEFWGWGLGREKSAAKAVGKEYFSVVVRDNSKVACQNAVRYSDRNRLDWNVIQEEVIRAWSSGAVDIMSALAIVGSSLAQICDEIIKARLMAILGSFALEPVPENYPQRRVYLVHPTKADNSAEVEWEGHKFSKPEWGDTTPYDLPELLEPAQEGAGGKLSLEVLGRFWYFHQQYSILRLMADR